MLWEMNQVSQLMNILEQADQYLDSVGMPSIWNITWALIFVFVGRWLARRSRTWFRKGVGSLDMTINDSVVNMTESIIYYGILLTAVFLALAALGIPIESLLFLLAILVLIVAVILQESLNNLAATIIFVVFQTYKQEDWVDIMGTFGQVDELQMFSTVITTIEQSTVTIPNGEILKNKLTNYSQLGYRRADMLFTISYKDDLPKAKQLLQEIVESDDRVLDEPPPIIGVQELGDKGVLFNVWPFVDMPNFVAVKQAISEQVKLRFDEAGITIPFPQRDVHVDGEMGQGDREER
jgi:small conductance mechanosensitive channel